MKNPTNIQKALLTFCDLKLVFFRLHSIECNQTQNTFFVWRKQRCQSFSTSGKFATKAPIHQKNTMSISLNDEVKDLAKFNENRGIQRFF